MSQLRFDVRVVPATDAVAKGALDAARLLGEGNRAAAEGLYRDLAATPSSKVPALVNLAALAIGLGEAQAARGHAMRALQLDGRNPDAWVNFGAASWNAGQRRDAAQATDRALALAPGMEAAAMNLNLMQQAVGQPAAARDVLAAALASNAGAVRLQQAMADVCRLLGDGEAARRHALAALALLADGVPRATGIEGGPEPDDPAARAALAATMRDACDRLQAAGIGHHLVGGVVLGIVREGRPFPGDKDIDFGIDFDADRDRVAAAFADGYRYMRTPHDAEARRWCMGFTHEATGVGVDLFFKQPVDGMLRINLGWPDDLLFDVPAYGVAPYRWDGRDWPMPDPIEAYLAADYGADWRSSTREVAGHVFDKRWLDSQLSSPSLRPGSVAAAVTLGLLRLLAALRQSRWDKALALCDQVLAREALPGVEAIRGRLLGLPSTH